MKTYGLIGYRLSHSFSKKYFNEKFLKENISDCVYENFPLDSIKEFTELLQNTPNLKGCNVTIPYKEEIIPYLDELDVAAKEIGAVNVVKILPNGKLVGYNSDYYGFKTSLQKFIPADKSHRALILGTGGAAKAVAVALKDLEIPYQYVSRSKGAGTISYDEMDVNVLKQHSIIINTSPLGMYPDVDSFPAIPYQFLTDKHYLYDLVYNPEVTAFMRKGKQHGAHVVNGLEMLIGQAEKAWEIWNQ
ncbi:shikimate dehydrogenase family protein [Cytophaga aurantiaca]|uniref:shikimate dehydrogenase family protein n=1 Tax=Cytophaga aurantiaca TaxID=29530 RepID=UPI000363B479|nr:shikimate dehydrogenase [Cytophaga aurantiaca]